MTRKLSLDDFSREEWAIAAPEGLKKLVQFALNEKAKHPKFSVYDELFPGFLWTGKILKLFEIESCDSGRYSLTPPELFPFGRVGLDGIHFGFVIHAPELEQQDLPIGVIDPSGLVEGVKLLGTNFEHALERLLSEALEIDPTDEERVYAIASLLNVHPDLDKRNLNYMEYGELIVPVIPQGWHFEPSSDGIGVLAPREAFIENSPTCKTWSFDLPNYPYYQIDAALQLAEDCLCRNSPGSALFILRELYWRSTDDRAFIHSKELWQATYAQLNRPLLSNVIEEEVAFRRQELDEPCEFLVVKDVVGEEFQAEDELELDEENAVD